MWRHTLSVKKMEEFKGYEKGEKREELKQVVVEAGKKMVKK